MSQKVTIGDVGLKRKDDTSKYGYEVHMMGEPRVSALTNIYLRAECDYLPVDCRMAQGNRVITWDEIDWDTSGIPRTQGDRR